MLDIHKYLFATIIRSGKDKHRLKVFIGIEKIFTRIPGPEVIAGTGDHLRV